MERKEEAYNDLLKEVVYYVDPKIYKFEGRGSTYLLGYEIHDPVEDYEILVEIEFTPDDLTPRGVWLVNVTEPGSVPPSDAPGITEFYEGVDGLHEFFERKRVPTGERVIILKRVLKDFGDTFLRVLLSYSA